MRAVAYIFLNPTFYRSMLSFAGRKAGFRVKRVGGWGGFGKWIKFACGEIGGRGRRLAVVAIDYPACDSNRRSVGAELACAAKSGSGPKGISGDRPTLAYHGRFLAKRGDLKRFEFGFWPVLP